MAAKKEEMDSWAILLTDQWTLITNRFYNKGGLILFHFTGKAPFRTLYSIHLPPPNLLLTPQQSCKDLL